MSKLSKRVMTLALGTVLVSGTMAGLSASAQAHCWDYSRHGDCQSVYLDDRGRHDESASEEAREHPRYENVRRGMYEQPNGSDHHVRPGMYKD